MIDTRHGVAQAIPSADGTRPFLFNASQDETPAKLAASAAHSAGKALAAVEMTNDEIQESRLFHEFSTQSSSIIADLQQNPETANMPSVWQGIYRERISAVRDELKEVYGQAFMSPANRTKAINMLNQEASASTSKVGIAAGGRVASMAKDQIKAMIDVAMDSGDFQRARDLTESEFLSENDRIRIRYNIGRKETKAFILGKANSNPTSVIEQLAGDGVTLDGRELSVGDKLYAQNLAAGIRNDRQNAFNQALLDEFAISGQLPDDDAIKSAMESGDMKAQDGLWWLKQKSSIKPVMSSINFANAYRTLASQVPNFRKMNDDDLAISASTVREEALRLGASASQAGYLENIVKNARNFESGEMSDFESYAKRIYRAPEVKRVNEQFVEPERADAMVNSGLWKKAANDEVVTGEDGKSRYVRRVWKEVTDSDAIYRNEEFYAKASSALLNLYAAAGKPSDALGRLDLWDEAIRMASEDMGITSSLRSSSLGDSPPSPIMKTLRADGVIAITESSVTVNPDIPKGECVVDGLPAGFLGFAIDESGNGAVVRNISKHSGTSDSALVSPKTVSLMNGKPDVVMPASQDLFVKPESSDARVLELEASRRIEEFSSTRPGISDRYKRAMASSLLYFWTGTNPPRARGPVSAPADYKVGMEDARIMSLP